MNALSLAKTAYATSSAPVRTNRGTEYDVFAQVTRRLKTADPKRNYPAYIEALHDNRQLWTLLAVDVADAANGLPQDLRARLFYLAEFTQEHTSKVVAGNADTVPLVEINMAVMRGLSGQEVEK